MTTATDQRPAPPAEPGVDRSDLPGPVRGRTLWVVFGSLLLIAGLWWGTFNVVEVIAHEERIERFTVPASELDRMIVDNDSGSVTVVGADTDSISVEAEISDGLRATGFRHEVVGSTLELRGSCAVIGSMWCRVTLRIEVPRHLSLEIRADNDSVDVNNIDGEVVVDADNGSVELADVSGSVDLDSDNGRISAAGLSAPVATVNSDNGRVELAFSLPPDSVTVEADNGSVEIAVPEVEGGYSVTTESENGDVDVDVNDDPDSPRTIRVTTDNGDIAVRTSAG